MSEDYPYSGVNGNHVDSADAVCPTMFGHAFSRRKPLLLPLGDDISQRVVIPAEDSVYQVTLPENYGVLSCVVENNAAYLLSNTRVPNDLTHIRVRKGQDLIVLAGMDFQGVFPGAIEDMVNAGIGRHKQVDTTVLHAYFSTPTSLVKTRNSQRKDLGSFEPGIGYLALLTLRPTQ